MELDRDHQLELDPAGLELLPAEEEGLTGCGWTDCDPPGPPVGPTCGFTSPCWPTG